MTKPYRRFEFLSFRQPVCTAENLRLPLRPNPRIAPVFAISARRTGPERTDCSMRSYLSRPGFLLRRTARSDFTKLARRTLSDHKSIVLAIADLTSILLIRAETISHTFSNHQPMTASCTRHCVRSVFLWRKSVWLAVGRIIARGEHR